MKIAANGIFPSLERPRDGRARDAICAEDAFQAILQHERARVDRDGSEFTLVVFPSDSGPSLAGCIRERMRSVDELGCIHGNAVGVLLPATSLSGGEAFAQRVLDSLGESRAAIPFEVYSYPRHWILKTAENPDGGGDQFLASRSRLPDVLERVFSAPIPKWKRAIDVSGALVALMLLSPLMLLVSLYIKIASRGPVLFRHERVGLRGRRFTFLKFRTMHSRNDQNAHKEHIVAAIRAGRPLEKLDDKGDVRIIPGGRLLRKTCIDELPQLINVLRGEMSLVGPRPCMPYEADEFLRWHTHRFDVLPGMTGLWQVSGKNKLTFETMIRLDISYAKRMSLLRDFVILFRTPIAIVVMVAEALYGKVRERTSRRRRRAEESQALLSS